MIKIRKGLNLPIAGKPVQKILDSPVIQHIALLGEEYIGICPSILVNEGDQVKKGQIIFRDKKIPDVFFTTPVCGVVVKINNNKEDNQIFQSIVIKISGDQEITFDSYDRNRLDTLTCREVQNNLLQSGLWTAIRTRPFSHTPIPGSHLNSIFVTAIDTRPLAADPLLIIKTEETAFNDGLKVLTKLTNREIYVCYGVGSLVKLIDNKQVVYKQFIGPHPAGLVGTHIHFLDPVSADKTVWHLNYQDVIAIGKLFTTGSLYSERVISLAGPQVKRPRLIRTFLGANLYELTKDELKIGKNRIISGSILWGTKCDNIHGYLGRFHNQVSVLREGNEKELFGWLMPGVDKFTITRTTVGHFLKNKQFNFTTTTNGSKRPMFPIGSYEQVMPLDIIITHLLRNLLIGDIIGSQKLGCLELDEEDLELCTYVCPSKCEYGSILREVLNRIKKEGQ